MDICSKLIQLVAQADFINGSTLLLIMVWHFVQEQVLFNKSPLLVTYLDCGYVHNLWYSCYPNGA
jgi:hypothetical protein